MTRNISGDSRIVGPVLQFVLFIVPVVMNGFYTVYSIAGWIVTGKDKENWSVEAESVGLWVCAGVLIFCALVYAYTRLRGGGNGHLLSVCSMIHSALVLLLTLSVFLAVRA